MSSSTYNRFLIGGLIGVNSSGNAYIINSYNSGNVTNLNSNYDYHTGGLIGNTNKSYYGTSSEIEVYIINSYNSGTITGRYVGGIFGWSSNLINTNNIYNRGTIAGNYYNYNIGYGDGYSTLNFANTYYTNNLASSNKGSTTKITDMNTLLSTLNSNQSNINAESINTKFKGYTLSTWKLSGGYPVFSWQE